MIKLFSSFDFRNVAGLGVDNQRGSRNGLGEVRAVFKWNERIDIAMNNQSRSLDLMKSLGNIVSPAGSQLAKVGSFAQWAIASNFGENIELIRVAFREAGSRYRGTDFACRLADLDPWSRHHHSHDFAARRDVSGAAS